jgi:hypothetical protein
VPAFPIFAPCRAREISLFGVYRYDLQIGTDDEEIEFAASSFALPGFKDKSSFEHARGRYQAASGCGDGGEEFLTLRFGEEDRCERRSVNDHICRLTGKPVFVVAKDLVWGAGVQNGQLVDAAKDFLQLARKNLTMALIPEPIESLFQRLLDCSRYGLSGLGCDFPS